MNRFIAKLVTAASFLTLLGIGNVSTHADNITWNGSSDTTFSNAGNWVSSTAPRNDLTNDVGVFSGSLPVNLPNLTANRSILGLDFQSAGWTLSASSGTLTVGTNGIDSAGSGLNTVSAPIAVGAAGGFWTIGSGNTLTLSGLFSGANALTKDGAGTLSLAGGLASTYTGVLSVNGGVVEFNGNGVAALGGGTGRGITVNNGGTVRWGASASGQQIANANAQFTINSGAVVDLNGHSDSFAFSGNEKITLSGGTVQTGAGTWTFTGNNASAAIVNGTTVSTISGTVDFGGLTTGRSFVVSNTAAGLDLNWSANIIQGGTLSFTGDGTGSEISLGGNNSFTGLVALANNVIVYLDNANALGPAGTPNVNTVAAGSTLVLRGGLNYAETSSTLIQYNSTPALRSASGNNTWNGALTNPGGANALPGVIEVDADSLTMAGSLAAFSSSSRQLGKTGAGALIYNNVNNFNATLYLSGGVFAFQNTGQANVRAGNYAFNGGVLGSPDNITMALGTGNTQMRFGGAGGGWAGYGSDISVDVGGTNTLLWGGGTAAQTPTTSISGGAVTSINLSSIYFAGAGYNGTEAVTFSGGTAGSAATATLQVDSAGVITNFTITSGGTGYTNAPTVAIAAPTRDGGLVNFLADNAPLILNSTISDHKMTLVDNINLAASGATFTGQREIQVLDNPATNTDRAVISGVISSSKSGIGINKTGAGVLELATGTTHTYDGATTVSAGTLLVNGAISGAGAVTVNGGATLGGNGSVAGAVTTLTSGSIIAPGASVGKLTLAGTANLSAGATFKLELGSAATPGTTYDQLAVGGVLTGSSAANGLKFEFTGLLGLQDATPYTVITFGSSTGLDYTDLSATILPAGYTLDTSFGTGGWQINSGNLQVQFALIPEPGTVTLVGLGLVGMLVVLRRPRRA